MANWAAHYSKQFCPPIGFLSRLARNRRGHWFAISGFSLDPFGARNTKSVGRWCIQLSWPLLSSKMACWLMSTWSRRKNERSDAMYSPIKNGTFNKEVVLGPCADSISTKNRSGSQYIDRIIGCEFSLFYGCFGFDSECAFLPPSLQWSLLVLALDKAPARTLQKIRSKCSV